MKIQFERVSEIPPRENWYRIEERERQNTKIANALPEGSWLHYSRIIVRTGYYYQPEDMPIELLEERANNLIRNTANNILDLGIKFENLWSGRQAVRPLQYDTPVEGPVTDEIVNAVLTAIERNPEYLLKHVFYQLRGDWLREQKHEDKNLRTFWYIDTDDLRQTHGVKRRLIGTKHDGYASYDGEYEPNFLAQWSSHMLYQMGWYNPYWGGKKGAWYVHPLDVLTEKTV